MGITISQKTNYSTLFNSISTDKNNAGTISLSDYASIKNGSYFKLMKAYYTKKDDNGDSIVKKGASTDTQAENASIQKQATSLTKSAEALLKTGSDSLFAEKALVQKDENGVEQTVRGVDKDAIFKAVDSFVKDYNGVLSAAAKSNNKNVLSTAANMTTMTLTNERLLGNVGITIGEDNKLSVDESKLKNADVNTLKTLFNTKGSYAYGVETKASYINISSKDDSMKASGTYSNEALYTTSLDTGSIYNSLV